MAGSPRRFRALAAAFAASALALSSCATFTDQPPPQSWQPRQPLTPQAGPAPEGGGGGGEGGGPSEGGQQGEIPPPQGCQDFDPVVIGTCLDGVGAVATLPGDGSSPTALVAERTTGRILLVRPQEPVTVFATVPVEATTDGGLTGLALSPTYAEDRLVYAYVTTAADNRLLRIAPGDTPKPVLTGIPRGPSGNRGALARDNRGALLLATGTAGVPAAGLDPASLAGKVLRVDGTGKPAADNPTPGSAVYASGLSSPGGLCATLDGGQVWVTDRASTGDLLYRVEAGQPLVTPAWTWADRPGVSGCAATQLAVMVAMSGAGHLQTIPKAPDGSFSDKPAITLAAPQGYGKLDGMDLLTEQMAVAGTVNKRGGTPVSSDDRAVVIVFPSGGGPGGRD